MGQYGRIAIYKGGAEIGPAEVNGNHGRHLGHLSISSIMQSACINLRLRLFLEFLSKSPDGRRCLEAFGEFSKQQR